MFEAEVIRVSDALSQHTRSVRKTLLVASTISLTVAMTGLIPTKIDALGVEFSQVDRNSMILLMAAVVAFMLLSFIVTAASDFTAWRISYASRAWDEESRGYEAARRSFLEERNLNLTDEEKEELAQWETSQGNMWRGVHLSRYMFIERIVGAVSWSRFAIDFVAPVLVAIGALVCLWRIWQ